MTPRPTAAETRSLVAGCFQAILLTNSDAPHFVSTEGRAWPKTFTDPRLCAAIVDRLTFGGHIIETGTTSYRLAHTRAHRAAS